MKADHKAAKDREQGLKDREKSLQTQIAQQNADLKKAQEAAQHNALQTMRTQTELEALKQHLTDRMKSLEDSRLYNTTTTVAVS